MQALILALAIACAPPEAAVTTTDSGLLTLENEWDRAQYATTDDHRRVVALRLLGARIEGLSAGHPGDANYAVWRAVVLAAEADATDGPQALSLVNRAKHLLEGAAPHVLPAETRGMLEATLGALYFHAPPWPLSFGDPELAEAHFLTSLSAAPNNPESLFYYGDYLLARHRPREAASALRLALSNIPRPGRAIGDTALKRQLEALLATANRHAPPHEPPKPFTR